MSKAVTRNNIDDSLTQISKEYWKGKYEYKSLTVETRYHTRSGRLKINIKFYKYGDFFWSYHHSDGMAVIRDRYDSLEEYVNVHHGSHMVETVMNGLDRMQQ